MSKFIRVDGKIYMREKGLKMQEEYDKKHGKECPTCSKRFKNLQQHVTKMHTKYRFEFNRSTQQVNIYKNDELIENNMDSDASNDEDEHYSYYFGTHELGFNLDVYFKTNKVMLNVSKLDKYGEEKSTTAFKNWSYTIV